VPGVPLTFGLVPSPKKEKLSKKEALRLVHLGDVPLRFSYYQPHKPMSARALGHGVSHYLRRTLINDIGLTDICVAPTSRCQGVTPLHSEGHSGGYGSFVACVREGDIASA
jgi:hypothetical protein